MDHSFRRLFLLPASLACAALLGVFSFAEDKKEELPKADPRTTPLEMRITGKVTQYSMTQAEAAAYVKAAAAPGPRETAEPPAPKLNLSLEILNTSDKPQTIWLGGDGAILTLHLKGEGAVDVDLSRAETEEYRMPVSIEIAPGKMHSIPLTSLLSGFRGRNHYACWTKAGEYTLVATLQSAVSPSPKGAEDAGEGFGRVMLTSAPMTVTVTVEK